jgi:hypothetical protein
MKMRANEFFRAAAANVSLHSEVKANSDDARRIVARWLAANSDFRLDDGRTLHQRLDSSRDTWTALVERVCTGGARAQPGNWLFALALVRGAGRSAADRVWRRRESLRRVSLADAIAAW